jgi:cell division protein FtsB
VEQRFDFRIKTANTDSVFQKIIETAETKGGYFTNFTEHSISLRLPVEALQEFQSVVASLAQIEEKGFESTDKSTELEKLRSQIQSRKKLLGTYMDLVKNAPFAELQSVEREMVSLNAQIENLQGRLQAIEKRAALASVAIYAMPIAPTYRPIATSLFLWINSTDINSLRRDF